MESTYSYIKVFSAIKIKFNLRETGCRKRSFIPCQVFDKLKFIFYNFKIKN